MSVETEKLADDLFRLLEYDQGFSYISDGMGGQTREDIISIAQVALRSHEKCARLLRKWLNTNNL